MHSHDIFMCLLSPLPHTPKKLGMKRKLIYFIRYTHFQYYLSCAHSQLGHLVLFWGEEWNRGRVRQFALCSSVTKNGSTSYHTRQDPGSFIHTNPFKHSRNSTGTPWEWHSLGYRTNKVWSRHCLLPAQQPKPCTQKEHSFLLLLFFLIISMF